MFYYCKVRHKFTMFHRNFISRDTFVFRFLESGVVGRTLSVGCSLPRNRAGNVTDPSLNWYRNRTNEFVEKGNNGARRLKGPGPGKRS